MVSLPGVRPGAWLCQCWGVAFLFSWLPSSHPGSCWSRTGSVPFLRHWPARLLPSQRRSGMLGSGWGEEEAQLQPGNIHTLCSSCGFCQFFWVAETWVTWIRWKFCGFGKDFWRWKDRMDWRLKGKILTFPGSCFLKEVWSSKTE